jgi:glucose/arabinose dehydrogenase
MKTLALLFAALMSAAAQQTNIGVPVPPLGAGPFVLDTAEQHKIRVTVVTKGLEHPWALVFLPDGSMLVTERPGRIRVIRDGVLDPKPLGGVPQPRTKGNGGLMDIALHPRFPENHLVYFAYDKLVDGDKGAPTVARGRLEGAVLTEVRDLVVSDSYEGTGGLSCRIVFGRDGMLYMATGGNVGFVAQEPGSLRGKILRVRDDGTVPPDNPFIGRAGYRPEIYTLGHRNSLGLLVNPETGVIWNHENGPNGGDKVNVIVPGHNYGWPVVSFGRDYAGPRISDYPVKEGMDAPLVVWVPSIAVAGMTLYTGDRFPNWKGNLLVGSMRTGEIPGTGHLERIVFNAQTQEMRRESMLGELHQRIREVRQGPDGNLYLLTDEDDGALLKIEPAP